MQKSIITSILLLACFAVSAEPEIKGTATELRQFLNDSPKTVVVTGAAEIRVPAHRAVVSLSVVTENKSLADAMKANLEIRNKLGDYLKGLGIPADRIESAKFSSTPKFGMFSEKARSYRIENEMRVTVQDENEFQGTASTVDKWAEVQFSDVEFEYADKEQQKQNVIAKACDNADERKKIYEQKLGLKLTPARFNEGEVTQRMEAPGNTNVPYVTGSSYGSAMTTPAAMATDESVTSFGEIVYTARVSVEYTVQTK